MADTGGWCGLDLYMNQLLYSETDEIFYIFKTRGRSPSTLDFEKQSKSATSPSNRIKTIKSNKFSKKYPTLYNFIDSKHILERFCVDKKIITKKSNLLQT